MKPFQADALTSEGSERERWDRVKRQAVRGSPQTWVRESLNLNNVLITSLLSLCGVAQCGAAMKSLNSHPEQATPAAHTRKDLDRLYDISLEMFREQARAFHEKVKGFRVGAIGDSEFIAAQLAFKDAKAFADQKEQEYTEAVNRLEGIQSNESKAHNA
jgi:hypothetical protein